MRFVCVVNKQLAPVDVVSNLIEWQKLQQNMD
jgi:hypothetical protein